MLGTLEFLEARRIETTRVLNTHSTLLEAGPAGGDSTAETATFGGANN